MQVSSPDNIKSLNNYLSTTTKRCVQCDYNPWDQRLVLPLIKVKNSFWKKKKSPLIKKQKQKQTNKQTNTTDQKVRKNAHRGVK